jgi:micrococcal nuclease
MATLRCAAFWLSFLLLLISVSCKEKSPSSILHADRVLYPVERVVDGDTVILVIDRQSVRVRLKGIDAPESVKPNTPVQPGGKEAAAYLLSLIGKRQVWVEYEGGAPEYDQYGRLLAYLYRSPDGMFVNAEMVRSGWAQVYRKFRFRHKRYFYSLQDEARCRGLGIWGDLGKTPAGFVLNNQSPLVDTPSIAGIQSIKVLNIGTSYARIG